MFVRYYVEVPNRFEDVESALLEAPTTWIPALARAADEDAEVLFVELGIGPGKGRLRKQAELRIGEPVRTTSRTVLPMSWEARGRSALFPQFSADLEVAPLGSGRTQLAISGRYRPPLGAVGRAVDRLLLHRIAEAAVKNFLDRVGARIAEGVGART